ncbi:MAG: leucine-rich repeat domain-containing protein [Clostridiales bacterium]|nr:leucine-rich repeat domain-containing protein [Clostridiales bacterium]
MFDYDKSIFNIVDLYDALRKQYEAYCKEYEENGYCDEYDDEYSEQHETPEECRERLLGNLSPGEQFILIGYNGQDEKVTIPEGVTGLNMNAFAKKIFVRSVYIPDTVTGIGKNVFGGCTALEEVRLSENMAAISAEAFKGCTALKSVTIPDSVEVIQMNAFDGCEALSDVRLGQRVSYIGWDAFARCKSLRTVHLPQSLEEVDLNVFYESGLEEIFIPKNVKSISSSAFGGCDKLKKIEVDSENPYHYSRDNCVYLTENKWLIVGRNDGTLPNDGSFTIISGEAFTDNPFVKELVVPESVTTIGSAAFRNCVNLKRVVLPNTLQSIGRCAFEGCTSLEEIVIPGSVKVIEGLSFFRSGVKRVVIKRGVEKIDDNAFSQCPNLREIYIPSSVVRAWSPIGYCGVDNPATVRVYIEESPEKNYEKWIKRVEGYDVVLSCNHNIFD